MRIALQGRPHSTAARNSIRARANVYDTSHTVRMTLATLEVGDRRTTYASNRISDNPSLTCVVTATTSEYESQRSKRRLVGQFMLPPRPSYGLSHNCS